MLNRTQRNDTKIALSIVAEISAVMFGRPGAHLSGSVAGIRESARWAAFRCPARRWTSMAPRMWRSWRPSA